MQVGIMQLSDCVLVFKKPDITARENLTHIEVFALMGDMPRLTHALHFIIIRIEHFVLFAKTSGALVVNFGRPQHVQGLMGPIMIILVSPAFETLPLRR